MTVPIGVPPGPNVLQFEVSEDRNPASKGTSSQDGVSVGNPFVKKIEPILRILSTKHIQKAAGKFPLSLNIMINIY